MFFQIQAVCVQGHHAVCDHEAEPAASSVEILQLAASSLQLTSSVLASQTDAVGIQDVETVATIVNTVQPADLPVHVNVQLVAGSVELLNSNFHPVDASVQPVQQIDASLLAVAVQVQPLSASVQEYRPADVSVKKVQPLAVSIHAIQPIDSVANLIQAGNEASCLGKDKKHKVFSIYNSWMKIIKELVR